MKSTSRRGHDTRRTDRAALPRFLDVQAVVLTGPAMVPLVRTAAALEAEDIPPYAIGAG